MNKNINVIELSDVSFTFEKGQPLLSGISTSIKENELVAIIGPNGSGKTTLLKLMMGFLFPSSGNVTLFNEEPSKSHLKIGYVPQINLYDTKYPISVLDVVLMGAISQMTWYGRYSQKTKEKAIESLKIVGLEHLKDRSFGTLSGGQAQRVLIARAIINSPKILFLDEPTANIDIETQKQILKLLVSLKKEMTIVMVTHHLQSFIEHVNRVLCVQHTLTEFNKEEICEHFALGVFHSPLLQIKGK
jgi:zinc transport system ATP-binding protein